MSLPTPASPSLSLSLPTVSAIFAALTSRFKLAPRESQIQLAEQVCRTLTAGGVCCIEAPTGTGKTLGYMAGAIEYYARAGEQLPIVIATATVSLQEQIIRYDIPRLVDTGIVDPARVAIAKGRGRYFCPRTTAVLEDKKMRDGQFDLFQVDKHVSDGGTHLALEMLEAWRDRNWDGDQDSWGGALPECWGSTCAASSDSCVGRACEHYAECPYMLSRNRLSRAQLIIANHDMVLADLAQRADEQQTTALPPKKYALIFDEAHNLPEKAVATRRATAKLFDTDWLRKLEAYQTTIMTTAKVAKALDRSTEYSSDVFRENAALLLAEMDHWSAELRKRARFGVSGIHNWELKSPKRDLLEGVAVMASRALDILLALKTVSKAFSEVADEAAGAEKSHAIRMLADTFRYLRLVTDLQKGLELFCSEERLVRWATRAKDGQVELHTQPMEGSAVLAKLLWGTQFPVALVSATLQIAGSFDRFKTKTGLPGHASCQALPPVFDYSRGYLHTPQMGAAPGEPGYDLELTDKISKLFRAAVAPGMLVLFTSRATMRRVVDALDAEVRESLILPDGSPVPELVARHKSRIDAGQRSILCGLDSMSEGLDLPGKYCGHVVITRLPFAVPGDPVEEARRSDLGAAWFEQAYLADMIIALIQSTGRLIRREDDHGVISVLDSRLNTKRYSGLIYAALPSFRPIEKLKVYAREARERGFDLTHGLGVSRPSEALPASVPASKPKLSLAHSGPGPNSVAVSPATPMSISADADPLARLTKLVQRPCETHPPVHRSGQDAVLQTIARAHAAQPGPFADHETPYLDCVPRCLPAGTPAACWAERQMPEAMLLGLLRMNQPWDASAPAWAQMMRLRPDVIQFADVLRSHRTPRLDARTEFIAAEQCVRQVWRALGGLGLPSEAAALELLELLEAEAQAVLETAYRVPSKEVLLELVNSAQGLAGEFRRPS